MSESNQEELILEKFEMKGEKASMKENSSTLKHFEEICTVCVQEEDVKMEGIIRNMYCMCTGRRCEDGRYNKKYVLYVFRKKM